MTKLIIEFTSSEMEALYHTACESFVAEQPQRFSRLDEKDAIWIIQSIKINECPGTLFYFDSFLEAKIFQEAYYAANRNKMTYVLIDDEYNEGSYCCWTQDNFSDYVSNQNLTTLDFTDAEIKQIEKDFLGQL